MQYIGWFKIPSTKVFTLNFFIKVKYSHSFGKMHIRVLYKKYHASPRLTCRRIKNNMIFSWLNPIQLTTWWCTMASTALATRYLVSKNPVLKGSMMCPWCMNSADDSNFFYSFLQGNHKCSKAEKVPKWANDRWGKKIKPWTYFYSFSCSSSQDSLSGKFSGDVINSDIGSAWGIL